MADLPNPIASPLPSGLPPELPDTWPPIARLLLLVGTCTLGAFAGMALAGAVVAAVWGVPLAGLGPLISGGAFHPHQRAIALTVQGLLHFGGFTLAPLLLLAVTLPNHSFGEWLRAQSRLTVGGLLAGAFLTLVSLPLISATIEWNAGLHLPASLAGLDAWMRAQEEVARRLTTQITQMDSIAELLVCVVAIALVPAVGEELVFRGIVQPTLTRWTGGRTHVGIWLTAIVFSAIHVQFLGFVPRLLLGAGFGYLYQWSGRLAVPIAAHFTNNALQVLVLYAVQRGALAGYDPDSTAALPWPWVVASVGVTAALLWVLHSRRPAGAPDIAAVSANEAPPVASLVSPLDSPSSPVPDA